MVDACLDENDVAELLSGGMRPRRREQAEQHLDRCEACRTLVADLASVTQAEEATPFPSDRAVDPGERIDHFEVGRRIGGGGMGDVYAATDTKLGRPVALKMVRSQLLTSTDAIARFQREAQATARFSHPNIVTIHFVGEHRGRPYLALEYLEGETLRDKLEQGPLPPEEAVRIATAIAEALQEAHRHGVLHRDLKPDNVHIDESGRVRVLDFGLAKFMVGEEPPAEPRGADAEDSDAIFETRATSTAGTPSYMAPEQWRGDVSGEATDVWALGVILFQSLSGRRPYAAVTAKALAKEVVSRERAPDLRAATGVPAYLIKLVARCLDKDPDRRPTTAEIITALQPTPRPSSGGWWIAAAAAVIAAAGITAWSMREQPSDPAPPARADTTKAVAATPAPAPAEPMPQPKAKPQTKPEPVVAEPEPKPEPKAAPRRPATKKPPQRRRAKKDALFGTRE